MFRDKKSPWSSKAGEGDSHLGNQRCAKTLPRPGRCRPPSARQAARSREGAGHSPGRCQSLARLGDTQASHPNRRRGEGGVSPGRLLQQKQQPQAPEPSSILSEVTSYSQSWGGRNSRGQVAVPGRVPIPFPLNTRIADPLNKMSYPGILLQCYGLTCPRWARARSSEQRCEPAVVGRRVSKPPEPSKCRAQPRRSPLAASERPGPGEKSAYR